MSPEFNEAALRSTWKKINEQQRLRPNLSIYNSSRIMKRPLRLVSAQFEFRKQLALKCFAKKIF